MKNKIMYCNFLGKFKGASVKLAVNTCMEKSAFETMNSGQKRE